MTVKDYERQLIKAIRDVYENETDPAQHELFCLELATAVYQAATPKGEIPSADELADRLEINRRMLIAAVQLPTRYTLPLANLIETLADDTQC